MGLSCPDVAFICMKGAVNAGRRIVGLLDAAPCFSHGYARCRECSKMLQHPLNTMHVLSLRECNWNYGLMASLHCIFTSIAGTEILAWGGISNISSAVPSSFSVTTISRFMTRIKYHLRCYLDFYQLNPIVQTIFKWMLDTLSDINSLFQLSRVPLSIYILFDSRPNPAIPSYNASATRNYPMGVELSVYSTI
jgi:hypothetical protein